MLVDVEINPELSLGESFELQRAQEGNDFTPLADGLRGNAQQIRDGGLGLEELDGVGGMHAGT